MVTRRGKVWRRWRGHASTVAQYFRGEIAVIRPDTPGSRSYANPAARPGP